MCAARIFNWPQTLAFLKHSLRKNDWRYVEQVLKTLKEREEKIWSGAYVITTHGRKMPKLDYCVGILRDAAAVLPFRTSTCEQFHHMLMQLEGFGSFLAGQVVADLKNTESEGLAMAEDWFYFSAPGPGSVRGLSWYFDKKITYSSYHEAIVEVSRDIDWGDCMQDLQNCMCEFDKYCRVFTGTGRSKRKYYGLR